MTLERRIARIVRTPAPEPGFMGPGHEAVAVLDPTEFERNDPFILLMDDRVDRADGQLGGAHPHAGFETVTFMLEGAIRDRDEGALAAGDALWMTAGSGVVHNEEVQSTGKVRLLQLWLTLPRSERWAEPRFERIEGATAPTRREHGVELKLYSGTSGGLVSPTRNHVPVTLAEVRLDAGSSVTQEMPAEYNGFVYVIEGRVRVGGGEGPKLGVGQVGWLDRPDATGPSLLRIGALEESARVLLYAGRPTGDPVVVQGPFVGDTRQDNTRKYREYLAGDFPRMSELAATHVAA